jgi:hypothetical protein
VRRGVGIDALLLMDCLVTHLALVLAYSKCECTKQTSERDRQTAFLGPK